MLYELAIATDKNLSHLARIRRRPRCDFDDRHDNKSPSGVAGMRIREFANTCGYMSLVLAGCLYTDVSEIYSRSRYVQNQPHKAAPKLDVSASTLDRILISL